MERKFTWHFNDEEYMKFAEDNLKAFTENFNYKSYITPHNEMRELLGRIVEEFQYLESLINKLLYLAIEKNIYSGKTKFNFDNYNSASKIINNLRNILIENKIADELIALIKFRNYIVHQHYIDKNRVKNETKFPNYLFLIYEANDYISNVINRIIGGATHIPNIFEQKLTALDTRKVDI